MCSWSTPVIIAFPREHAESQPDAIPDERRYLPALLVMFGLANLSAYVRDAAIAAVFGASARTDAYFIAAFLPTLLATILIFESTVPALVPLLSRLSRDPASARRLLQVCLGAALAVLLAAFALVWFAALPIVHLIAGGWSPGEAHLSASLLRTTACSLPPLGLTAVLGAVLNVRHRYAAPPLGMTAMNVTVIAATLTLHGKLGIYAAAWGMVAGSLVSLVWQGCAVARLDVRATGPAMPVPLGAVARALLPMLAFSSLAQYVTVVERWLASSLPAGRISYLVYAGKLMMSPLLIITAAGSLVAFVAMSHASAAHNDEAFRTSLTRSARLLSILLAMATVALIALRRPIVQLALQHGEFSSHDADVTSSLLAVYALGLLPNGLSWLLFRSLQSRERYWEAVRIAALSAGVYAGCAAALFHLWGLIGIAAAFPVSQTAACVLLYATHPRLLRAGAADILRFARPLALVSVTVAAVLVALTAGASLLPIGGTLRDVADLLGGGVIIVAGLSFGMPLLQVPEGRWIRASLVGRAGRPARRSALSGD